MSIGGVKTSVNRAKGLRFEGNRLVVAFRDGREVHIPLRLYPSLLEATPSQRAQWIMIGPGKGFHWPDLDLDLSVEGLILGMRESIPAPPRTKARRSA
ncbi:MAG: DUF2442 domain-containing protein [Tepidisphaeraceae bacterium]|jgi:hypothetical protein